MDISFWELVKVVIIGIVEGVTEWLPVSSTGHMILVDEFIKLNVSPAFYNMFLVVIQLGAILAVVVLNFERLNPFSSFKSKKEKRQTVSLWLKVLTACVPAAVIGLMFNDYMEEHFMSASVVAGTLILYGAAFIWTENYNKNRRQVMTELNSIDLRTAFYIGLFQCLSLVPGTSRSGATILGGILLGCSRLAATEFTFYVAIPVMFGASLLKLAKFGLHYTADEVLVLVVGMTTAFIVSILSIRFLLKFIKTNDFKPFGWYRIALGAVVLLYLA